MRALALILVSFSVASAAGLSIRQATVERTEDGPPVYASEGFTAGEMVYFSFFAEGFQTKGDQVNVSFIAEPKDPGGLLLATGITGRENTTLTPEDKNWRPKLRGSFVLPGILLGGEYSIDVELRDDLAGVSAKTVIPFRVFGPHLDPVTVLSIQKLNFYSSDTEERPLEVAAFRVDEQIHVRFLVAGYKHDEKGAIHVSYGIALTDSAGHSLFENPSAAEDSGVALYPKPYVPGELSFSLKPGTPLGEYTLTVTARDLIGSQQTAARGTFRLE